MFKCFRGNSTQSLGIHCVMHYALPQFHRKKWKLSRDVREFIQAPQQVNLELELELRCLGPSGLYLVPLWDY